MDGDLSLSQSLGGLRIANPDDASASAAVDERPPTSSPNIPARTSSATASPNSSSEAAQLPQLFAPPIKIALDPLPSSLGQDAIASTPQPMPPSGHVQEESSQGGSARERRSVQVHHQAQLTQQSNIKTQIIGMPPGTRGYRSPSGSVSRPTSSILPQALSGSGPTAINGGQYRLRTESSRSSLSGLPNRSNSRSTSASMQAGVPTREDCHSDRSYRQGAIPLPKTTQLQHRSSRGYGIGPTGPASLPEPALSSSPYHLEGGPLSSSEEWKDRGAATGIHREIDRDGRPISRYVKKGVKDFNFGRTLGEGSYSTVIAATDRQTLREYAIKVLDKRHIIKEKKVKYVNIEKDTLNRLTDHPGVVRLYYTFQDERSLYFVLDVASGGELLGVLKRMSTFDEECTRFYGAQILDTVDYMHSRGVIHRDLKPENVLLDDAMHVKITDFGTAKILESPKPMPQDEAGGIGASFGEDSLAGIDNAKANSFVGTAEYVSPELLTEKSAGKASDLWAFGCIIYQLLAGRPPFKAGNEYQTFQKIVSLEYEFPAGFPPVARDLVERLLVLDPAKRLSIGHVKNHEFFDGIIWGRGLWSQKAPRLKSRNASPPEPNVIKLNGGSSNAPQQHRSIPGVSSSAPQPSNGQSRPQPRVITKLPPPTQLDIEWSPVLTNTNERILKLGNLIVQTAPAPHSPNSKAGQSNDPAGEAPKKLSRFFGGTLIKKRQRLVMVTSSARIILAAAGGDEKKMKTELLLLSQGCAWRSMVDGKGFTVWCVDMRDKQYTFEDPKLSPAGAESANESALEWLKTLEKAREMALSQNMTDSLPNDDAFQGLSGGGRPGSSLGVDSEMGFDETGSSVGRLIKGQGSIDSESSKGKKRFSKRQSKSGLSAVF